MNVIIFLFLLLFMVDSTAESTIVTTVTTDNTLGTIVSPTLEITGGQTHGTNLFHSFEQFNLGYGDTASFSDNCQEITNVISRVTGKEKSIIAGRIETKIPNFYFINPHGIVFGNGVDIDVPGAVHFSTANYLTLHDGGRFDATSPQQSVLTVAPPAAFGFLDAPAKIKMQNVGIENKEAKGNITFVGGDITLNKSSLNTQDGSLRLVSLAGAGEVSEEAQLSDNAPTKFGKVRLSDSILTAKDIDIRAGELVIGCKSDECVTTIDATHSVDIEADNMTMTGGKTMTENSKQKEIVARIRAEGQIDLNVHQSLKMDATSVIEVKEGLSGNISITADTIELTDDATIDVSTYGTANAGNIEITAESLSLLGEAWLLASSFNSGKGGTITVNVENLKLSGESAIAATTFGSGQGGDIHLNVTGQLSLADNAVITAGSTGTGDQVQDAFVEAIKAIVKRVIDKASPNTDPFTGGGKAGTIEIKTDNLTVNGGTITVYSGSDKVAGDIHLNVKGELRLKDGKIITDAAGNDGGSIVIEADGTLNVHQSKITANAKDVNGGSGGNVTVGAPKLMVLNDSQIKAESFGGDGGQIHIVAGHFVQSTNSEVSADTESKKHVDGTVEIEAIKYELKDDFTGLRKDFLDSKLADCSKEKESSSFKAEQREGVSPQVGDLF